MKNAKTDSAFLSVVLNFMKKYTIIISEAAKTDIENFFHHICDVYKQPLTAIHNRKGLYDTIKQLSVSAGSIVEIQNDFIQSHFGANARRINYKRMAIIFVIVGHYVFIKRVIASSLIY